MRKATFMAESVEVTFAARLAARVILERDARFGRPSRPGVIAIANAKRDDEGRWMAKRVQPPKAS